MLDTSDPWLRNSTKSEGGGFPGSWDWPLPWQQAARLLRVQASRLHHEIYRLVTWE